MIPELPTADLSRIAASALQEVLATQFKLSVTPAAPAEIARAAGDCHCLSGSVNLDGARMSGSLRLQLPETWIHHVNVSLAGPSDSPITSEDDAFDLTGELCNMVAGRIAASLAGAGYTSGLSTPAVIRGRFMAFEAAEGGRLFRSDWACEGHLLKLTLLITFKLE